MTRAASSDRTRCGIALLGALVLAGSALPAHAADCPTEDEIKATITKWHTDYNMSDAATYHVTAVTDFEFGPITFGKPRKGVTPIGERMICPLRVDYSFVIKHSDSADEKRERKDEIQLFYKNDFDEWAWKFSKMGAN